jgi:hypothetical protein
LIYLNCMMMHGLANFKFNFVIILIFSTIHSNYFTFAIYVLLSGCSLRPSNCSIYNYSVSTTLLFEIWPLFQIYGTWLWFSTVTIYNFWVIVIRYLQFLSRYLAIIWDPANICDICAITGSTVLCRKLL